MPLTKPTVAQLNTVVTEISDPITLLNRGSTQANVDVGFVLNRDGGVSPNVAIYWNETTDSMAIAFTTSTGGVYANIALTSYANLIINSLTANSLSVAGGGLNGVSIGATTPSSGNFTTLQVNNSFYANSGIPSTSTITGAVVIPSPGGLGVGGNIVAGQLNTTGNVLATGLSVFGNTRIGSLAVPGALHTIIGNIDISGAGTEYVNVGGNILAVQGSFGSVNSTGFVNTSGNISTAQLNAGQINTTGNVLATSGVFNLFRVNHQIGGGNSSSFNDSVTTAATANQTLRINGGNQYLFFNANLGAGSYNPFTTVNDIGLIFSGFAGQGTGNLLIAPWNVSQTGIRIIGTTGLVQIPGQLTINANNSPTAIALGGTSGVGNIGVSGTPFNTAFLTTVNATGNVLAGAGTFNALTVNGNESVTGVLNVTGNVLGATATFSAVNSSGFINTSGNVSGAVVNTGALNVTGTTTLAAVNSTGFINTSGNVSGAVVNAGALNVSGTSTVAAVNSTGLINTTANVSAATVLAGQFNTTGNILGSTGVLSVLDLNSTTNATDATGTTGALQVAGGASIAKDLWVGGNLYAANIIGVTANVITVQDPLLFLAPDHTFPYDYDIGFYSAFTGTGLTTAGNITQYTAVVRNEQTNTWTFASNLQAPGGGHVVFNSDTVYDPIKAGNLELTVTGTALSAVGFINTTANISAAAGNFGSINSTGFINTSGNVSGAVVLGGTMTTTGTLTAAVVNSTGNILGSGGILSSLTVNGNETVTGFLNVTGNVLGATASFGAVNSTGFINTTANISGATVLAGTMTTTGTLTAAQLNTSGNILAQGAVFNTERVNGTSTVNVLNSTGNILGTGGIFSSLTVNGTLASTGLATLAGINSSANILATGAVLNSLTVNGALTSTGFINTSGNVSGAVVLAGSINSTGFINTSGNVSASQVKGATAVFTGTTNIGELFVTTNAGDEGGQLNLAPAVTNTTLVGNIVIDVFQNRLRIFEGGGTNRGGYFDLSTANAAVGTNFGAGGGGGSTSPGGVSGQIQFNSLGTFGGTANLVYYTGNGAVQALGGTNSTSTSTGQLQVVGGIGVSGNVWADQIYAANNGNGQNIRIGDDAWLGDVNVADTTRLMGAQNGNNGYLRFGNVGTETLGRAGAATLIWTGGFGVSGPLYANATTVSTSTTTGALIVAGGVGIAGNVRAGTAGAVSGQFHSFVGNITQSTSGGAVYINTTGNILAAVGQFGAVNSTGFINTSGNVSASQLIAGSINAGNVRQTTSATVPAVASVGDQWYDSGIDTLFQYTYDGTNFFWVDISGQPLNVNIGTVQGTSLSITGNGTVTGNLTVSGFMVGKSTQALYADLAEKYATDAEYDPGTVLIFGGSAEVTQSTESHDPAIAGVVSTDPAYLMNSGQQGCSVALTGRVPCWVRGPVNKGDRLVSSDMPGIAERLDLTKYQPGCIIGKSLESVDDGEIKKIEVVVGRL